MMTSSPVTSAMIRAAGKAPASTSSELTRLLDALAEAAGVAIKAFTAAPVRVEPDGLSIAVHETPVANGIVTKLTSARGPLSPVFMADRLLVMALCEAAFGGSGTEPPYDGAERPLSKTERRLREALLTALAAKLPETLAPCFAMDFGRADEEDRKQPSREASSASHIAARLLVYVFGYSGEITLLLPEEETTRLLANGRGGVAFESPAQRVNYLRSLQESVIEVTAMLPAETKPLGEVTGLRRGQLLKLRADANTQVLLMADGQLLHKAYLSWGCEGMSLEICGG
jgi:flagellar motor switch protein FliM